MSKIVYVRFYDCFNGCVGLVTCSGLRDARKLLHDRGFVFLSARDFDYVCEEGDFAGLYANICVTLAYEEMED